LTETDGIAATPSPPGSITLPAADGYALAGSLFAPAGEPGRVVLVAPATGVRRRLYAAFARHLAGRGMAVMTWDWRGIGDSRPPRLRGFQATMLDWARGDLAGAIAWAGERYPGAKLVAVGHSFGGQSIGLAPNAGRLDALVTVAAQSGWWGHWPARNRLAYAALWHLVMPGVARAVGYVPGWMGIGEDLPGGVARQWAAWCRRREYLGDWSGHAAFRAPILSLSFSDDAYAPPAAVDALHRRYASAPVERRHVTPAEAGARRIGHFGFFRTGVTPTLWSDTADWLLAR
jgi:predicted alpha/beta hydrolase